LHGAGVFRKELCGYRDNLRAMMLFTETRFSMHQVGAVAKMCADDGVPLTFNLYSPTRSFLQKFAAGARCGDQVFRVSARANSFMLRAEDLVCVHRMLGDAMGRFPRQDDPFARPC
jgi:hypothetical protein